MTLTELRRLAEEVRGDRNRARKFDECGDPNIVAQWVDKMTPERVLALLDVVEAAKAMREYPDWGLDRTEYDLAVFDAALAAFEKEHGR